MLIRESHLDIQADTMGCPACGHLRLDELTLGELQVDACRKCGGAWFERGELNKAVRNSQGNVPLEAADIAAIGKKVRDSERKCPQCKVGMAVFSCSEHVKLEVDYCGQCMGFWLDKNELDHAKVLADHEAAVTSMKRNLSWQSWLIGVVLNLPAEFNAKTKKRPIVTMTLITICALIYLLPQFISKETYYMLEDYGVFVPARWGTVEWFWELITSQFLHGSLMHLVGNMYFLYLLGDNVEDVLGRWQYLGMYLLSGVGGNLAHFAVFPDDRIGVVGASGAISGLMAAYMVYFSHARLTFPLWLIHFRLPVVIYMAVMLGFDIMGAILRQDNVAHFAHIGGFLTGYLIARLTKNYVVEKNPVLKFIKPSDGHKKFLTLNWWPKKGAAA